MSSPSTECEPVFRLRSTGAAAAARLWAIDQACFPPDIAYSLPELRAYLAQPHAFALVAEAAPAVDGTESGSEAGFVVARTVGRGGHVITLDVLPAYRRRGVGARLMAAVESRFRRRGMRQAQLEVAVNNLAALRFYRHHGYRMARLLPGYYPGGLDGLLMTKTLSPPA